MSAGLSADSPLVSAEGWFLVRRLPDSQHPSVWAREPIAAWTLGRRPGSSTVELVAVLGDGTVAPRRFAEEGRDAEDFHARGDALGTCECARPETSVSDPRWCWLCAGVRRG